MVLMALRQEVVSAFRSEQPTTYGHFLKKLDKSRSTLQQGRTKIGIPLTSTIQPIDH